MQPQSCRGRSDEFLSLILAYLVIIFLNNILSLINIYWLAGGREMTVKEGGEMQQRSLVGREPGAL